MGEVCVYIAWATLLAKVYEVSPGMASSSGHDSKETYKMQIVEMKSASVYSYQRKSAFNCSWIKFDVQRASQC